MSETVKNWVDRDIRTNSMQGHVTFKWPRVDFNRVFFLHFISFVNAIVMVIENTVNTRREEIEYHYEHVRNRPCSKKVKIPVRQFAASRVKGERVSECIARRRGSFLASLAKWVHSDLSIPGSSRSSPRRGTYSVYTLPWGGMLRVPITTLPLHSVTRFFFFFFGPAAIAFLSPSFLRGWPFQQCQLLLRSPLSSHRYMTK